MAAIDEQGRKQEKVSSDSKAVSRREFLKVAGVTGGVLGLGGGLGGLLAACGGEATTTTAAPPTTAGPGTTAAPVTTAAPGTTAGPATTVTTGAAPTASLKIGFVSPQTGGGAAFGEVDPYVIGLAEKAFEGGLDVGGTKYAVEILQRDGQTDPARGAEVTQKLIDEDKVDLILATSTPETCNPVSDAAEAGEVPHVVTNVPWQAWYFSRGAKPGAPSPFKYGFAFTFGAMDFFNAYMASWPQVQTNKKVAVMYPNDADGNSIRDAYVPEFAKNGYTVVDPGAYQDGTNDFSPQLAKFKAEGCEIFNAFPLSSDFAVFWRQAAQQNFKPKIAQIGKAGMFPSENEALGDIGLNLLTTFWWSPDFPYSSSLTGISSKDLGDGYTAATSKQWNQQLSTSMALFDVAAAAFKASGNPKDKQAVANALKTLKVDTPVGPVEWGKFDIANVTPIHVFDGQWVKGTTWPREWVCVDNSQDANVKVQAQLVPYAS
jgi:branched-chain amino acid transport system substrate-binding protein